MRDYTQTGVFTLSYTPAESPSDDRECITGDFVFDVPEGYRAFPVSHIFSNLFASSATTAENYKVCKTNGEWPVLDAVFALDYDTRLAATISSFDELQSNGSQVVKVEHPNEHIPTNRKSLYQHLHHWYEFDGQRLMENQNYDTGFFLYPTEPILNTAVFVWHSLETDGPDTIVGPDGNVYILSLPQHEMKVYTDSPTQYSDIAFSRDFPVIESNLSEYFTANSYDVSDVSHFPFYGFSNFIDTESVYISHRHIGANAGSFPTMEVYAEFDANFTDLVADTPTKWFFIDYPHMTEKSASSVGTAFFGGYPSITKANLLSHPLREMESYGYR